MDDLKVYKELDAIQLQKQKNTTSINHNRANQACVNTADPANHFRDAQCVGRDAWDAGK